MAFEKKNNKEKQKQLVTIENIGMFRCLKNTKMNTTLQMEILLLKSVLSDALFGDKVLTKISVISSKRGMNEAMEGVGYNDLDNEVDKSDLISIESYIEYLSSKPYTDLFNHDKQKNTKNQQNPFNQKSVNKIIKQYVRIA
jgi:hypothetical protein